jgi:hypothetical protein
MKVVISAIGVPTPIFTAVLPKNPIWSPKYMCFQICLYSSHHSEVWCRYSFSVHEDIFLCFSRHAILWQYQSKSFLRHSVVVTVHIRHEFCHVILCEDTRTFTRPISEQYHWCPHDITQGHSRTCHDMSRTWHLRVLFEKIRHVLKGHFHLRM